MWQEVLALLIVFAVVIGFIAARLRQRRTDTEGAAGVRCSGCSTNSCQAPGEKPGKSPS